MYRILLLAGFICLSSLEVFAQDMDSLRNEAKRMMGLNRPADAVSIYEKILERDPQNYESLAFLGDYYYLLGKQMMEESEAEYKAIIQPNRMQSAHYQDEWKRIYYQYFEKADVYFLKALHIQNNDHLNKLVRSIAAYREKVGLSPASTNKKNKK